jgi:hypothetical protein
MVEITGLVFHSLLYKNISQHLNGSLIPAVYRDTIIETTAAHSFFPSSSSSARDNAARDNLKDTGKPFRQMRYRLVNIALFSVSVRKTGKEP